MGERENRGHLSDIEVILYCDRELSPEDALKVSKHLESCESCSRLVVESQTFLRVLYKVLEDDLSVKRKDGCLSDMEISAYFENRVSSEERMVIEDHLSKCGYCLSILVETEISLKEGIEEEEPHFSYEEIMDIVKQQLREERGKALFEKFTALAEKSPPAAQNALKRIKNDIEAMFKNTFAYPSPQFAPVFGEHRVTVLSPFGKVRYPIIFEWMPYERADRYTISVEDTGWSFKTQGTRVEVNSEELKLIYGKEYMWELKIMKGEEIIDEITGFFSLATEDEIKGLTEIEKQLKGIEPEQDRFILWGGILEKRGFYMEAIEQYKNAYSLGPLSGIAYRIAYCYDKLELEELRDEWNKKIQTTEDYSND